MSVLATKTGYCTSFNTIYEEKIILILKNARFSGKGHQLLIYERYENL